MLIPFLKGKMLWLCLLDTQLRTKTLMQFSTIVKWLRSLLSTAEPLQLQTGMNVDEFLLTRRNLIVVAMKTNTDTDWSQTCVFIFKKVIIIK